METFGYKVGKNGPWNKGQILLSRFRIEGQIGAGSFGNVYIVSDLETLGLMAVKTFKDEYFGNRKILEQFLQEANTWIDLGRHENIIEAVFIQVLRGKPCIFMEYIEGTNLFSWISNRQLDLQHAIEFAIQLYPFGKRAYLEKMYRIPSPHPC